MIHELLSIIKDKIASFLSLMRSAQKAEEIWTYLQTRLLT